MKNIKKFENNNAYNAYENSESFIAPNMSLIENSMQLKYKQRYEILSYLTIEHHNDYNEYIKLDNKFGDLNVNSASYTMKFKAIMTGGESYSGNAQYHLIGDEAQSRFFIRRHKNYSDWYSFRLFNSTENDITSQEGYDIIKTGISNINNSGNNEFSTPFKPTFGELDIYMFGSFKEKDPNTFSKFWFGDFYYFQLFKGDTLLLDLIPMRDNSLKVNGIYDKVKQKFYPIIKINK